MLGCLAILFGDDGRNSLVDDAGQPHRIGELAGTLATLKGEDNCAAFRNNNGHILNEGDSAPTWTKHKHPLFRSITSERFGKGPQRAALIKALKQLVNGAFRQTAVAIPTYPVAA